MANIRNDFKDYIYERLYTKTKSAFVELRSELSKHREVITSLKRRVEKALPKIKGFSFLASITRDVYETQPSLDKKMNDIYIEFKLDKNNQTKAHLDDMIDIASAEIEIEISLIIEDLHREIALLRRRVNRFVRSK